MKNEDPLSRKIATLISKDTFEGRALKLGLSGVPDTMSHILGAIDDTMMLRNAVFAVGQSSVTLRISGKRLQAVVAATDDLSPPEGLIDAPLNSGSPELFAHVATLLKNLTSKEGTLTLERIPTEANKQYGSGVGIQILSENWDTEAPTNQSGDPFDSFVASCIPFSAAVLTLTNGEVVLSEGDQLQVDLLRGIYDYNWAAFEETHKPHIPGTRVPMMRVLDALGPKDHAFVFVEIDEKQCLVLISTEFLPKVAAAWAVAHS